MAQSDEARSGPPDINVGRGLRIMSKVVLVVGLATLGVGVLFQPADEIRYELQPTFQTCTEGTCVVHYTVIIGNTGTKEQVAPMLSLHPQVFDTAINSSARVLRTGVVGGLQEFAEGAGRATIALPALAPTAWVLVQFTLQVENEPPPSWEDLEFSLQSGQAEVLPGDPRVTRFLRGARSLFSVF